jgi:hypothetical protein
MHMTDKKVLSVKARELLVDNRYQRSLDEARAMKIGNNFQPDLFGLPVVSLRKDGRLYLIDGQHRGVGLCRAGRGDQKVDVQVLEDLTVPEEAMLFHELNHERHKVQPIDDYRARLVAKVPEIVEIDRIARSVGLKVTTGNCKHSVSAVCALEDTHINRGNLKSTLSTLRVWSEKMGDDVVAYDNRIIRYVSRFLADFPAADPDVLAMQLVRFGAPSKLTARVKLESRAWGGTSPQETAIIVLLEVYNKRNRRKLVPDDRIDFKAVKRALDEASKQTQEKAVA